MANANAPCGFSPVRHKSGGQIRISNYTIASGYAANLGRGDPVELTGTGKNIQAAAGGNVDNLGIFAGVEYTDAQGQRQYSGYWASGTVGTDIVASVWDDPMIVFEVQGDSVAEGDIGALADWTLGTPSAVLERSTTSLAVDAATGTTGKSIRLLGLVQRANNNYGAYAKIECVFAEHALLTGAAGAAGV